MTKKYEKHLNKLGKIGKYDCWNFDIELACFVLPRLKFFRNETKSIPSGITTREAWDTILDYMILAFEDIEGGDYYNYQTSNQITVNTQLRRGLYLFVRYLPALWT